MKKVYLSTILLSALFYSCCKCDCDKLERENISTNIVDVPTDDEALKNLPQIKFEKLVHEFGDIMQGETVLCTFKFKNTGGSDLVITSASASCGCTIPEVPKLPIKPGEEGEIKVKFDSADKEGTVKKEVIVVTNCVPNTQSLHIQAMIHKPSKI